MWTLSAKVHEQMCRTGGQSEARSPVFKSPIRLGTHLPTHCSRDERLSRRFPARVQNTIKDGLTLEQRSSAGHV
ncbi:hypothetical protein TNCV_4254171 [Trichonephila clavipes]|nr:hypothetical protein TNCV_4254171 [Trichonephila clavipes]